MSEIQQSDADRYGNNCTRYTHADGHPTPESSRSCRGCTYSYDPDLYDGGCSHPDGPAPRQKRMVAQWLPNQLKTSADQFRAGMEESAYSPINRMIRQSKVPVKYVEVDEEEDLPT